MMLIDQRQALKAGDTVQSKLVPERKDGKRGTAEVKTPVRALSSGKTEHRHLAERGLRF